MIRPCKRVLLFLFLSLGIAFRGHAENINIKGSDTIVRLTQHLAEVYMQKNPQVRIAVSGGGSATGIAAIINQTTDIADASREMREREIVRAAQNKPAPEKVILAIDAIAIIVNSSNPVSALTMDQLGAVFRGDITNWKNLGGEDLPITLYGRHSTSGTYMFLRDLSLKADYSPRMSGLPGNAAIVQSVKADRTGIGFVGMAFIRKEEAVRPLLIAATKDHPYLNPLDEEIVRAGVYPLTRPLIQYIHTDSRPEVRDFVAFELSPEGQQLVAEEGFFPVPSYWKKRGN
jgi:phosphate transport system substrate-binding protein